MAYPQPSGTTTPALVYFPAGTYLISSSILPAYLTQLYGDPTSPPTLKATANFAGFGLIDGNPYYTDKLNFGATVTFWRQVRNFIIDTTAIAPGTAATGMHWYGLTLVSGRRLRAPSANISFDSGRPRRLPVFRTLCSTCKNLAIAVLPNTLGLLLMLS